MTTTDTALRALDAAGPTTATERARLDARVERMLADEPGRATAPPPRPGRHPRRVAALVGAAAAVAAGLVLLPGPSEHDAAWATWTADPAPATASEVSAVVEECRARLDNTSPAFDADAATVALSERRGDVVAVILRDPARDMSAHCLADDPPGAESAALLEVGLAGSEGPPAVAPARGFLEGSMAQFGGDRTVSLTDGAVGDDVVALTIHAAGHTVEATVAGGRYTAWWPGPIFADEDPGHSGRGGPRPSITFDVTLEDGTVIHDAAPSRPIWP